MSVFDELKRRKIVQWGLAYLATAWLVVQVVAVLGDKFLWPLALQQGLIILLAFGFFVALVLAWYHGEKGRQRVSGAELLIVAGVLVTAGAALTLVRGASDETAASAVAEGDQGMNTSEAAGAEALDTELGLSDSAVSSRSVAVLPLDDHSPTEENAFFARAMTEEITTALSKVPGLAVTSRNSASRYPESGLTVTEFARKLGVAHVIEGSVQRVGDRARITVQLIDAQTDEHLWTQTFDRSLGDLLEIQVEVARRVADRLAASFSDRERERILAGSTDDPVAYDLFLRAMALEDAGRGRETRERQIELLRNAIERDRDFGQAWGELGRIWAEYRSLTGEERWTDSIVAALARAIRHTPHGGLRLMYRAWNRWIFWEGPEDLDEAAGLLRQAVNANPWNLKLIRNLQGLSMQMGDLPAVSRWGRRRVVLDPLDELGWIGLASAYKAMGLDERSEQALRRAQSLDPDNVNLWEQRALLRMYQGRFRDAIAASDTLEAIGSPVAPFWKGWAHLWAGNVQAAHETFERIPPPALEELGMFWWPAIAHVRIHSGDSTGGRRLLDRTERVVAITPTEQAAYARVAAAAVRGDPVDAVAALRRYAEVGPTHVRAIAADPVFSRVRDDSAFRAELEALLESLERMRRQVERELRDSSPPR